MVSSVLRRSLATRWFFLRYGDPEWHLRLRFHGSPRRLAGILPLLQRTLAAAVSRPSWWKVQVDTYERELERYGGTAGLLLAEQIFHVDSEAVLEMLHRLAPMEPEQRQVLGVLGGHRLLEDLGVRPEDRLKLLEVVRDTFGRGEERSDAFRSEVSGLWRALRPRLVGVLAEEAKALGELNEALPVLAQRSRRLRQLGDELRRLQRTKSWRPPALPIEASAIHLFLNRLLVVPAGTTELQVYELLRRLLVSRLTRPDNRAKSR